MISAHISGEIVETVFLTVSTSFSRGLLNAREYILIAEFDLMKLTGGKIFSGALKCSELPIRLCCSDGLFHFGC